MSRHKVRIAVEKDSLKSNRMMVAIRDEMGAVIGIPLRDASMHEATNQLPVIRFAFEYGVRYSQETMEAAMRQLRFDLTSQVFEEP